MEDCAPDVRQPTLMIEYTGDNSVFPSEAAAIFGWLGAADKSRVRIHGNHHGQAVDKSRPSGQPIAGQTVRNWLAQRRLGHE